MLRERTQTQRALLYDFIHMKFKNQQNDSGDRNPNSGCPVGDWLEGGRRKAQGRGSAYCLVCWLHRLVKTQQTVQLRNVFHCT